MADTRPGWFAPAATDDTIQRLRATVAQHLEPPINVKAAEFWSEVLADHVRNQHRLALGFECHTDRWDRDAPVRRVVEVIEEAA
jgi:hypothetical protein